MKMRLSMFRSFPLVFIYFLTGCGGGVKQDAGIKDSVSADTIGIISNGDPASISNDTKSDTTAVAPADPDADSGNNVGVSGEDTERPRLRRGRTVPIARDHRAMNSGDIDDMVGDGATHSGADTTRIVHVAPPPPVLPVHPADSHITFARRDLIIQPISSGTPVRKASLGFSCPDTMVRRKEYDVNVYVSLSKTLDSVRSIVRETVGGQTRREAAEVPLQDITTVNIAVYRNLSIHLISADSSFKIKNVGDPERQELDSAYDNTWHWSVVPLTNRKEARLILKVQAELPNGSLHTLKDKVFTIRVKIEDSQFFRDLWLYLLDNPAWFITVILVPGLGFLIKRWLDKKKEK